MKTLPAKRRLILYELALSDYEKKEYSGDLKNFLRRGFCMYFRHVHDIELGFGGMKHFLPELYSQEPKNKIGGLWFPAGEKCRRILCLKKAIEEVKTKN